MPLVNLTSHPLHLHTVAGESLTIPPDPRYVGLAATSDHRVVSHDDHDISLTVRRADGVKGLPDPAPDTLYVVPVEVAWALGDTRDDVAYPAETSEIRDDDEMVPVTHLRRLVSTL
jgi:hypothetical protein